MANCSIFHVELYLYKKSTSSWFIFIFQGCDIINNTEKYIYKDKTKLLIKGVDSENHHSYTCTLSFNLGGGMGLVSETIDAVVRGKKKKKREEITETCNTKG